jgi:hypothetical protein
MALRSCTELRPARIALPAPDGPPIEGLMKREEMTMTTTMTVLREVDPDEMTFVDGGVNLNPSWPIVYYNPPPPTPYGPYGYNPGSPTVPHS